MKVVFNFSGSSFFAPVVAVVDGEDGSLTLGSDDRRKGLGVVTFLLAILRTPIHPCDPCLDPNTPGPMGFALNGTGGVALLKLLE